MIPITHKEGVEIAYRWMMKNTSVGIGFKELVSINREIPDVIGFGSWGHSVLIEVKVSRSDFLCDKKKPFRIKPEEGMGKQRFYICPKDLIKKEELPEGWGLIYINEKKKARCVHFPYKGNVGEQYGFTKNNQAEMNVMYSALRRLHLRLGLDEVYARDIPPDLNEINLGKNLR